MTMTMTMTMMMKIFLLMKLNYGLDNLGSIPYRSTDFFLQHQVQTNPDPHPASYPMERVLGKSHRSVELSST